MGNSAGSVKSHMQNAQRTGVFQLTKCNLNEFPKEILQLQTNLRTLDLSYNKLKILPPTIGQFSQLKQLTINNNRLQEIPPEIGNLKKLETLSLNNNLLRYLPRELSQLTNLKTVNLSGNLLTEFPAMLCGIKSLDFLDLSRNKITHLGEQVAGCRASEINLNQNQIVSLSDAVSTCPRLKVLRLEENCLQISAIKPKILSDSQISLLAVEGNLFESKDLHNLPGFDKYMERYTATKKKMI